MMGEFAPEENPDLHDQFAQRAIGRAAEDDIIYDPSRGTNPGGYVSKIKKMKKRR